jgi:hypothetical protein
MIESKNGLEITQVMALFFFFFFRVWTCSPPAHETWEPPFTVTGKDLLHSRRSTADLTPSQKENPTDWEKQQAKKTNITKFQEGQLVLLLLLGKNKLWEIHIAKPVVAFMHAGPWILFFSFLHTLLLLLLLLQTKKKGCRKQPAILQELELAQRTNHDDASSISCCKPLELQN